MNNGGPAFPAKWRNEGDRNISTPTGEVIPPGHTAYLHGLTIRDYFAAAALTGMCANMENDTGPTKAPLFAADAYTYADAMIAERAK